MLPPLGSGNIFVLNYGRKYSFIPVNCQGIFWIFLFSSKGGPDRAAAFVENAQACPPRVRRLHPRKAAPTAADRLRPNVGRSSFFGSKTGGKTAGKLWPDLLGRKGFGGFDERFPKISLAIFLQIGYNLVTKATTRLQDRKEEAYDMRVRILCLLLCLAMVLPMGSWALAAEAADGEQTTAGTYFLVDGVPCEDPGLTVYNGITYVSLVNAVLGLRPDAVIGWEGEYAVVTAEGLSIRVRVGDQYIEANGRCLYVLNGVIAQNGRVLVPVRTIAQAMGGWVSWNQESGVVEVYSGESPIASGDSFYDSDALYWLSHIINAESGNQPMDGKLAVGTVIMNRVASPRFPNTISDVIFAPNQFTPVSNGSIYREPNAESVAAAKLILEGVRVGGSSLYFVNPSVSPNSWAQRNRTYVTTIGAHAFFS